MMQLIQHLLGRGALHGHGRVLSLPLNVSLKLSQVKCSDEFFRGRAGEIEGVVQGSARQFDQLR